MNEILQAIGTVGFPIVCCMFLLWRDVKREEQTANKDAEVQKKHDENLNELRKVVTDVNVAINNLTVLITHFLEKGDNNNG